METLRIHNNIYNVGLTLVQQVSELMKDDDFRRTIFSQKYKVLSSVTSSRTEALKNLQREVESLAKTRNTKENQFQTNLDKGVVTLDDFDTEVTPVILEFENKKNAVIRSQQELQKWKNIQTRIFANDKNVIKQVTGGIVADVIIKMCRAVISNEDVTKYQSDLIEVIRTVVDAPELNLENITHETLEEAFKEVVVTSLKSKTNAIKSNNKLLDMSLDKMVHDFNIVVEEPSVDDPEEYENLYKGNKIRKVEEFINKYKDWVDGKIVLDKETDKDMLDVFEKMNTAGYDTYKETIDGIKLVYYNGISQLANIDIDALDSIRPSYVYNYYKNQFLPLAEKIAAKESHISDYGVNRFALLLTYIFFTLFIAENVGLMFVLSI